MSDKKKLSKCLNVPFPRSVGKRKTNTHFMPCWLKLGNFHHHIVLCNYCLVSRTAAYVSLQHPKTVISQSPFLSCLASARTNLNRTCRYTASPRPAVHRHPTRVNAYRCYAYWRTFSWRSLRWLTSGIYLTPVGNGLQRAYRYHTSPPNVKKRPHPWPSIFVENPPESLLSPKWDYCTRQSCSSLS